jgi:hypothetical protein
LTAHKVFANIEPLRHWYRFARFCAHQLRIVDMQQRLVPLQLNWLQRRIVVEEIRARRRGVHPWFLILKYRKGGVTTLQQALSYWTLWRLKHQACLTLAHRPQDVRLIHAMVERFFEHQPAANRHRKTEAVTNWIEFPQPWDGMYMAGSAGATSWGRGSTLSRLHLSEAAHYADLATLHTGLAKSLGDGSAYVMETTPNGREGKGQTFYEFWQAAKRGDSRFIPLFFPWHHDPRNRLPLLAPDELDPFTDDERRLMERHKLDLEQLKWWREERRAIVADGGAADRVHGEHPADDDSCFLYGSDAYFDLDDLAKCELHIREPIRVEENGRLRIYEEPKRDGIYVIGADPAGGGGSRRLRGGRIQRSHR